MGETEAEKRFRKWWDEQVTKYPWWNDKSDSRVRAMQAWIDSAAWQKEKDVRVADEHNTDHQGCACAIELAQAIREAE